MPSASPVPLPLQTMTKLPFASVATAWAPSCVRCVLVVVVLTRDSLSRGDARLPAQRESFFTLKGWGEIAMPLRVPLALREVASRTQSPPRPVRSVEAKTVAPTSFERRLIRTFPSSPPAIRLQPKRLMLAPSDSTLPRRCHSSLVSSRLDFVIQLLPSANRPAAPCDISEIERSRLPVRSAQSVTRERICSADSFCPS